MPAKKGPDKKSAKAAEQKFGKAARKAAERGGKKPAIWQKAERTKLPGAMPLPMRGELPSSVASAVTRTVEASASEVYRAFNDPNRRGWCHEPGYAVRASVAPRSLVLGFRDGSVARVSITRKGNVRSLVSVELNGLPDGVPLEPARTAWRAALERLTDMLQ